MNLSNLKEILEAREARAARQQELLLCGGVLISFSLNIPGPVKNAELYRIVFDIGLHKIETALQELYGSEPVNGENTQYSVEQSRESAAGPGAFFLLKQEKDGILIKKAMAGIEESDLLGRLWDIDVLVRGEEGPEKISRSEVGYPKRKCMLCDASAFTCVRAARHKVPEVLKAVVDRILSSEEVRHVLFEESDSEATRIASEALRAILYEVITTPKPGLVDAENNGAHKDMNITVFFDSAAAIAPYFKECAQTGIVLRDTEPEKLLSVLRPLGVEAEKKMYCATGGVNTHKGAVFTLGILCASAGWEPAAGKTDRVLSTARRICSAMDNGSRGIREEAMNGYPSVREAMKELETDPTGVRALIKLMTLVDDSNVVRRGGEEKAAWIKQRAEEVLSAATDHEDLCQRAFLLDGQLIKENLSPGGAADLLAAAFFLKAVSKE